MSSSPFQRLSTGGALAAVVFGLCCSSPAPRGAPEAGAMPEDVPPSADASAPRDRGTTTTIPTPPPPDATTTAPEPDTGMPVDPTPPPPEGMFSNPAAVKV